MGTFPFPWAVPVFYAPAGAGGIHKYEIGSNGKQMGSIPDFDVVPRYLLLALSKLEIRRNPLAVSSSRITLPLGSSTKA
jgi:hypothetical protein